MICWDIWGSVDSIHVKGKADTHCCWAAWSGRSLKEEFLWSGRCPSAPPIVLPQPGAAAPPLPTGELSGRGKTGKNLSFLLCAVFQFSKQASSCAVTVSYTKTLSSVTFINWKLTLLRACVSLIEHLCPSVTFPASSACTVWSAGLCWTYLYCCPHFSQPIKALKFFFPSKNDKYFLLKVHLHQLLSYAGMQRQSLMMAGARDHPEANAFFFGRSRISALTGWVSLRYSPVSFGWLLH